MKSSYYPGLGIRIEADGQIKPTGDWLWSLSSEERQRYMAWDPMPEEDYQRLTECYLELADWQARFDRAHPER